MAEAQTQTSRLWERLQAAPGEIGAELKRGIDDIGATYQACLYNGWHTQSAGIESPEHIAEGIARDAEQKKLEPEREVPKIGLEKE